MNLSISLSEILLAGAVAGFTIYLGLPLALVKGKQGLRVFLNALSVGILLFLFVEIAYQVIEKIEGVLKLNVVGYADFSELIIFILFFVGGFSFAFLGLVSFEKRTITRAVDNNNEAASAVRRAVMVAAGIGLHNFSEGLVIGQSFAGGALALGLLLAVGFALHNGTEGFGIAGPLAGHRPSLALLFFLGLIGGGPTVLGTYLGTFWISEPIELLFLALAAGAILYVVGELIHLGKVKGHHWAATWGLLIGFFLAFASDLIIERAMVGSLAKHAEGYEIHIEVGEFYFKPDTLYLRAGQPVKLVVENKGEAEHEIEIFGKGMGLEAIIPYQKSIPVYLNPLYPGEVPFICDMPGHLAGGMRGKIIIEGG